MTENAAASAARSTMEAPVWVPAASLTVSLPAEKPRKQSMMAQYLGPCTNAGDSAEALGCWFRPGLTLNTMGTW